MQNAIVLLLFPRRAAAPSPGGDLMNRIWEEKRLGGDPRAAGSKVFPHQFMPEGHPAEGGPSIFPGGLPPPRTCASAQRCLWLMPKQVSSQTMQASSQTMQVG